MVEKKQFQIDKFREAAKELEADESVENFERQLKEIVKPDKEPDTKEEKKPAD